MFSSSLHRRPLEQRKDGVWLLCVLLLVLCINARLANYQINHRFLKLATTQSFVEGTETLRKLPKAPPPLLWESVAIAAIAVATLFATRLTVLSPIAVPFGGFDAERYLRPPPVQ